MEFKWNDEQQLMQTMFREFVDKELRPIAAELDEQERFKAILELLLADCVRSFERLPIIQDAGIIKNILCSGVWIKFNQHYGISTK